MLSQLFWAGLVLYLYLVGTSLYRLFFPTQCGHSTHPLFCVRPLLQQGERSRQGQSLCPLLQVPRVSPPPRTSLTPPCSACLPVTPPDTPLHLLVYASTSGEATGVDKLRALGDDSAPLLLSLRDLVPPTAATGAVTHRLPVPLHRLGVRTNSTSVFLHAFLFSAAHPAEAGPVGYVTVPLIRHMPARTATPKLLLAAANAAAAAANGSAPQLLNTTGGLAPSGDDVAVVEEDAQASELEAWVDDGLTWPHGSLAPHLRPSVVLRLAHPTPGLQRGSFPGELSSFVVALEDSPQVRRGRSAEEAAMPQLLAYRPLFGLDELSITRRQWRLVSRNGSAADPEVVFRLQPVSLGGFAFYQQMSVAVQQMQGALALTEDDTDDIRAMVSGENLKIWALTTVIGLLHTIFSYLAFKNDIGFWKKRSSLEGLSIRTFFSNLVCQTIIFAKLCDSGNVSWIILGESGLGCCLEAWKVSKIAARRGMLRLGYWRPGLAAEEEAAAAAAAQEKPPPDGNGASSAVVPALHPGGIVPMTALETATDEADAKAMRWLLLGMWPLITCWGCYSLLYRPHKSWLSWLLHTAGNGVYLYGFVAMCPQLYINYRLKSVAHLPWRAMGYKVFNTIIDDVFAFAIAMPWSHRLACFRDDVVFLVFVYQMWIYPVDKSRPNEFGRAYDDDHKMGGDGADAQQAAAVEGEKQEEKEPALDPVQKKTQ